MTYKCNYAFSPIDYLEEIIAKVVPEEVIIWIVEHSSELVKIWRKMDQLEITAKYYDH